MTDSDDKQIKIETQCRVLFGTPAGRDVLFFILEQGMMFDHCTTQEEMGRNNLAKEIMAMAMSFEMKDGDGRDFSTTRSRRLLEWFFKRFNKEKKK